MWRHTSTMSTSMVLLVGLCVGVSLSDHPSTSTTTNLRALTDEKLKTLYEPYKALEHRPPDDLDAFAFLADALNSQVPATRDEATTILAGLPYAIRASRFDGYLSEKYPIGVRVVALIRSLQGNGADNEYSKRMLPQWKEALNAAMSEPVVPPHFAKLVASLSSSLGSPLLIEPRQHAILARRTLFALSSVTEGERNSLLVTLRHWIAKPILAQEIASWYGLEADSAVRRLVLWDVCIQGNWEERASFEKLLEVSRLAEGDWDAKNAQMGRQLRMAIVKTSGAQQ